MIQACDEVLSALDGDEDADASDEPIIRLSLGTYKDAVPWFRLTIGPLKHGSANNPSFERALSTAMRERLLMHGRCVACGEIVHTLRTPCSCGAVPAYGYLEVEIEDRCAEPSFDTLLGNWLTAGKNSSRRAKVLTLPGDITTEDVALLLRWQCDLCFYCGVPFEQGGSGPLFHRDHVVPVVRGGHFTIGNTVLACSHCNCKKGRGDAAQFSRLIARTCPKERRAQRAAMRKGFLRRLRIHLSEKQN